VPAFANTCTLAASYTNRMELLEQRLERLKWNEPLLAQLNLLESFHDLADVDLQDLTSSRFIKSPEAGILIQYLGFPRLYKHRSNLLIFLQDINWPARGTLPSCSCHLDCYCCLISSTCYGMRMMPCGTIGFWNVWFAIWIWRL
jgi:hypothetical protein